MQLKSVKKLDVQSKKNAVKECILKKVHHSLIIVVQLMVIVCAMSQCAVDPQNLVLLVPSQL